MTVTLNKKLSEKEIKALLEKIKPLPKLFDAQKYFNKIHATGDPLQIQQEMRDEYFPCFSLRL